MKEYSPDKKGLSTLQLLIIMAASLISAAALLFIPILSVSYIVAFSISAIALFLAFIYFPMLFKTIKYLVTDNEIIRTSGVFIKSHQSIRFSAIQYYALISSPFSKHTGMNFIVFFVYGGQQRLIFLNKKDADEILAVSSANSSKGEEI